MQIRHGATCEGESSDSLPSVGGDEEGVVLDETDGMDRTKS